MIPRWVWLLFPAATMSAGWGLRGFIGGGPLGAMIPGALVAMCLILLLGRERDAAAVAAFGAVGIGFGGQMTYGQTIGLAFQPETQVWGLTGLGLKGAVWGCLGGAILGLGLARDRYSRNKIIVAMVILLAGTFAGWKWINEPKLVYFSNPVDKPRPEIWAGLLIGAALMLGWLGILSETRVPLRFAAWGALAGGFGFAFGGWIQVAGRSIEPNPPIGYWKVMEFTLGWCLGLAYGHAAWLSRGALPPEREEAQRGNFALGLLLAAIIVPAALWLSENLPGRMDYSITGAALIVLACAFPELGWHLAVTMTYCAFAMDWAEHNPPLSSAVIWAIVAGSTIAVAWLAQKWSRTASLFPLLLWTAVATSVAKTFILPGGHSLQQWTTEAAFATLALAVTVLAAKVMTEKSRAH